MMKTFKTQKEAIYYLNDPLNEVKSTICMQTNCKNEVDATYTISDTKYQTYLDTAEEAANEAQKIAREEQKIRRSAKKLESIRKFVADIQAHEYGGDNITKINSLLLSGVLELHISNASGNLFSDPKTTSVFFSTNSDNGSGKTIYFITDKVMRSSLSNRRSGLPDRIALVSLAYGGRSQIIPWSMPGESGSRLGKDDVKLVVKGNIDILGLYDPTVPIRIPVPGPGHGYIPSKILPSEIMLIWVAKTMIREREIQKYESWMRELYNPSDGIWSGRPNAARLAHLITDGEKYGYITCNPSYTECSSIEDNRVLNIPAEARNAILSAKQLHQTAATVGKEVAVGKEAPKQTASGFKIHEGVIIGHTSDGGKKYDKFEDAIYACNAMGDECGGITFENGTYTLRKDDHVSGSGHDGKYVSWLKLKG